MRGLGDRLDVPDLGRKVEHVVRLRKQFRQARIVSNVSFHQAERFRHRKVLPFSGDEIVENGDVSPFIQEGPSQIAPDETGTPRDHTASIAKAALRGLRRHF